MSSPWISAMGTALASHMPLVWPSPSGAWSSMSTNPRDLEQVWLLWRWWSLTNNVITISYLHPVPVSEYQVLPSSHTPIGRQPCSSWCANKGVAVHCHGYIFCQWNYPCSNGQVISEVQWTGHEDCVSLNCHFIGDITGKSWQSGQVKLIKWKKNLGLCTHPCY